MTKGWTSYYFWAHVSLIADPNYISLTSRASYPSNKVVNHILLSLFQSTFIRNGAVLVVYQLIVLESLVFLSKFFLLFESAQHRHYKQMHIFLSSIFSQLIYSKSCFKFYFNTILKYLALQCNLFIPNLVYSEILFNPNKLFGPKVFYHLLHTKLPCVFRILYIPNSEHKIQSLEFIIA